MRAVVGALLFVVVVGVLVWLLLPGTPDAAPPTSASGAEVEAAAPPSTTSVPRAIAPEEPRAVPAAAGPDADELPGDRERTTRPVRVVVVGRLAEDDLEGPIKGVHLRIVTPAEVAEATTGEDGSATVEAASVDFIEARGPGGAYGMAFVQIRESDPSPRVVMRISPGLRVAGTVTDAGGAPLGGARVVLVRRDVFDWSDYVQACRRLGIEPDPRRKSIWPVITTHDGVEVHAIEHHDAVTAADGTFAFDGVERTRSLDTWSVVAEHEGLPSRLVDVPESGVDARCMRIVIARAVTLVARVDGLPEGEDTVSVHRSAAPPWRGRVWKDGAVRISGATPGETIVVSWNDAQDERLASAAFRVPDGLKDYAVVPVRLGPGVESVGSCAWEDGTPVAADVEARGRPMDDERTAEAGADGHFRIRAGTRQDYEVVAWARRPAPASWELPDGATVAGRGEARMLGGGDVRVVLRALPLLALRARDSGGREIPFDELGLRVTKGTGDASALSLDVRDGVALLPLAGAPPWRVSFEADGYRPFDVEVAASAPLVERTVELERAAR